MASISITYEGPPVQRQVVKATAMAPLSALLAEACTKMKPPLDPAHASLAFNKKPLSDLACPFRLANIPAGSSLTLLYNKPSGAATAPLAASTTALAAQPTEAPAPVASSPPGVAPVPATRDHAGSAAAAATASEPAPLAATHAVAAPNAAAPVAFWNPDTVPATAVPTGNAPLHNTSENPSAAAAVTGGPGPVGQRCPPPQAPSCPDVGIAAVGAAGLAGPAEAPAASAAPAANQAPGSSLADPSSGAVGARDSMDVDATGAAARPHSASAAGAGGAKTAVDGGIAGADGDSLGLGRPSVLFTREALEASSTAASGAAGGGVAGGEAAAAEEGDEFFEVTPEDLVALMRSGQARRHQEEAAGFRTRAGREAEERAKASSYSHVAIRAHLPGGIIMQASFAATETVRALRAAVHRVLVPELAITSYIFTTPPRQVLKPEHDDQTLYHAGLVPAAHVHVGVDEEKASGRDPRETLRPEFRGLVRDQPDPYLATFLQSGLDSQRKRQDAPGQPEAAAAGGRRGDGAAGAALRAPGAGAGGGAAAGSGGAKVPKWLKLGGK